MNRANLMNTARTASVLAVLAGIYLIVAPWWVGFSSITQATNNSWILGIIVIVLGLVSLTASAMAAGINLLAGLWLVVSPWAINFTNVNGSYTNTWITGIVVAALALVSFACLSSASTGAGDTLDNDRSRTRI